LTAQLPGKEASEAQPAPAAALPSGWMTFTSDKGKFSIAMPGSPTRKEIRTDVPPVKSDLAEESYQVVTPQKSFAANFGDFPPGSIDQEIVQDILNYFTKKLTLSLFGGNEEPNVTGQLPVTVGSYPGRELRYTFPSGLEGRTRIFLVK